MLPLATLTNRLLHYPFINLIYCNVVKKSQCKHMQKTTEAKVATGVQVEVH